MKYTVTRCPNTPEVKAALLKMKPREFQQRNRGRGPRLARWPNDARYHQSLPIRLARWVTCYGEPKTNKSWLDASYTRFKFVKLQKDGRLRIRLLPSGTQASGVSAMPTNNHQSPNIYRDLDAAK